MIAHECERRGLAVPELVGERAPRNAKGLERLGLDYALERIAAGEAGGLVVAKLEHLSTSSTELGALIEWLSNRDAGLVAGDLELDTGLSAIDSPSPKDETTPLEEGEPWAR